VLRLAFDAAIGICNPAAVDTITRGHADTQTNADPHAKRHAVAHSRADCPDGVGDPDGCHGYSNSC